VGVTGGRTPANRRSRPESGRWSAMLARAAALIVLVLYVAGIAANRWLDRRIGPGGGNPVEDAIVVVGFGLFALVGAVLAARRPGNLIGWILSVASLVVLASALETYAAYVMTTRGRPDWLAVVGAWANSWYWFVFLALVFVYLPLLFPDGRLPSRRWLPVAVVPGIGLVSMVVLGALVDTLRGQDIDYRIDNPIGIEGLAHVENLPVIWVFGGFYVLGSLGAVASLAVRFRRSGGDRAPAAQMVPVRRRARPDRPVFGLIVWRHRRAGVRVGSPGPSCCHRGRHPQVPPLRHRRHHKPRPRLRRPDRVAGAGLLRGHRGAPGAVPRAHRPGVLARGGCLDARIAALFSPFRRRLQGFIDRGFYRQKYDAHRTLESFSAVLRNETDLDRLRAELLAVLRETMRPEHASLWLRAPTRRHEGAGEEPG